MKTPLALLFLATTLCANASTDQTTESTPNHDAAAAAAAFGVPPQAVQDALDANKPLENKVVAAFNNSIFWKGFQIFLVTHRLTDLPSQNGIFVKPLSTMSDIAAILRKAQQMALENGMLELETEEYRHASAWIQKIEVYVPAEISVISNLVVLPHLCTNESRILDECTRLAEKTIPMYIQMWHSYLYQSAEKLCKKRENEENARREASQSYRAPERVYHVRLTNGCIAQYSESQLRIARG